ncbi:DUF1648 domain-containing protein [Microbacterium indicum]|uniref:DUF1648 domain-containing protein n=1 Tax=Microbacterium indicum TaxID=358100 RepID=UPI0004184F48|nr:DUF1648 domain-containing protein [Microbacterium indicum]
MTDTVQRARRARRRYLRVAVVVPLVFYALLMIAGVAALPLLPDPVATHWGFSGPPNGFSPRWTLPLIMSGIGMIVTLIVAVVPLVAERMPPEMVRGATSYRWLAAVVWGETALIGVLAVVTTAIQVGADDARGVELPAWWILAAIAGAASAGVCGYLLTIDAPRGDAEPVQPDALRLGASETAVWIRTTRIARTGLIVTVSALAFAVVVGGGAIVLDVTAHGSVSAGSIVAATAVGVALLAVVACTSFRVRIDRSGLEVRSVVGFPRTRIAREDIASVEVVQVNPMGEYGGWGWRYGAAGTGIVTRAGEAIRVRRRSGRAFTVTVDDAATGAALLRAVSPTIEE